MSKLEDRSSYIKVSESAQDTDIGLGGTVVEMLVRWIDDGRGGICEELVVMEGGGFKLLGVKSSKEFKLICECLANVGGERDNARVGVRVVGMGLFPWIRDASFDDMSMMVVFSSFLGGFLVEEDALETIFGDQLLLELDLEMEKMRNWRMFEGDVSFHRP
ncbi:hypothetical protein Tco_0634453 [Tanacetum coccineum]